MQIIISVPEEFKLMSAVWLEYINTPYAVPMTQCKAPLVITWCMACYWYKHCMHHFTQRSVLAEGSNYKAAGEVNPPVPLTCISPSCHSNNLTRRLGRPKNPTDLEEEINEGYSTRNLLNTECKENQKPYTSHTPIKLIIAWWNGVDVLWSALRCATVQVKIIQGGYKSMIFWIKKK